MWTDLEAIPLIKPTQAGQPDTITRKLKSFQLEGLDWMTKQEKSQWKGGLLGDEMGMGKTIQAVSLIMSDYPAKDPTLVVVVSFHHYYSYTAAVHGFVTSIVRFHHTFTVFYWYRTYIYFPLFLLRRSSKGHACIEGV